MFTEIFSVTCVDVKNLADGCTKSFENAIENEQFNWHGDFVFQSEEEAKEKIKENLEKYFLSEKVRKYVLATGTKNFYLLQHFFSIIDL